MRSAWSMLVVLVVFGVLAVGVRADDKEVTLKGTIQCAKCSLKETKTCTTAIVVKQDGKDVTYYLKDKGNKEEYHEAVCGGDKKEGTLAGHVTPRYGQNQV